MPGLRLSVFQPKQVLGRRLQKRLRSIQRLTKQTNWTIIQTNQPRFSQEIITRKVQKPANGFLRANDIVLNVIGTETKFNLPSLEA